MAKVTLQKPRSYRIANITFRKKEPQIVSDDWAREHLCDADGKPLDNFDVVFAEDIERMAAHGVRTASKRPPTEEERSFQLQKAAEGLSPNNPAHYTKAGKPQTQALTELMGWPVTAADRDAAFPEAKQAHPDTKKTEGGKVETTETADVGGAKIKITRRTKPTPPSKTKGDMTAQDIKHPPEQDGGDGSLDTGAKAGHQGGTEDDGVEV